MSDGNLQRWSREVAENPGAPAFVPLGRAYRRQGRRDAALRVVLRGLERNPEHIGGHLLLALLHVDKGERQLAGDEWATVLRFDPGNFDAHRGLGFLALERSDLAGARRHLEAAAEQRGDDPAVTQALEVLRRREAAAQAAAPARAPTPARPAAGAEPARLFASMSGQAPFLGALLLDGSGLVLGGELSREAGDGETLGALMSTAVEEARRASELLGLGEWEGLLLESENASLHVAAADEAVVLLAARPGAPAGWVVRAAERAGRLAQSFLEAR